MLFHKLHRPPYVVVITVDAHNRRYAHHHATPFSADGCYIRQDALIVYAGPALMHVWIHMLNVRKQQVNSV